MKSTLGALVVAAIVAGVLWMREPESTTGGVAAAGGGNHGVGSGAGGAAEAGAVPPPPDVKAFAHLPPAERINVETKARMEHNAAWREKLRSGDFSTLPPEALPQAPAPPLPTPQ